MQLRLILLGDIFLGGELTSYWHDPHFDPFHRLHRLRRENDIIFANVETVFYRGPLRPFRSGHLWSPPESVRALTRLPLDVAGYANNHTMDFGAHAMMVSIELLESRGIACIGSGLTPDQASRGCIIEKNGLRVGFLAYTTSAFHVRAITAGPWSVGCAPMKQKKMRYDILRLRPKVDVLCVSLHWGYEFLHVPHPNQRTLAMRLIEWGADVIMGTHPHVVQGYESIEGRPVFYSLGNCIFPGYERLDGLHRSRQKDENRAIVGLVEIRKKAGSLSFNMSVIPIEFKFPYVQFLMGHEKREFENDLILWNQALNGEGLSSPIFSEAMVEMKRRDKVWNKTRLKRILRRFIWEPLMTLLGPHCIEAIKLKWKKGTFKVHS